MKLESPAEHFERGDVVEEYASFDFLLAVEEALLRDHAEQLPAWRMLDLGVGAGRTSVHFMGRAGSYVGADYSAAMVERCRERFAGRIPPTTSFEQADARTLEQFEDGAFDFVLFSFNGIDTVGGEHDRERALAAIARVCAPGALLCLSSHNLLWFHHSISPVRAAAGYARAMRRDVRAPLRAARLALRRRRLNPGRGGLRHEGVIVEERPRYELQRGFYETPEEQIRITRYSTTPGRQVRRLRDAGFEHVRIHGLHGEVLPLERRRALAREQWLHYVCRRAGGG